MCILSVDQTQEALARAEEQNAELSAVREMVVDKEQVESLLQEVASLNDAYTRLQVSRSIVLC